MPNLDDLYATYCGTASELQAVGPPRPRGQVLQAEADRLWLSYIDQGGGREPWHKALVPWAYKDGFVEMRHSSPNGPVDQLRKLLGLPQNVGPHYMASEQSAVELFQASHNLPVTGIVDRRTWATILADRRETKPAQLPTSYELPGSASKPVPMVIRTRKRWMLALDCVPQRTFANQHNLAVLAQLAYEKEETLKDVLVQKWNTSRLREDTSFLVDGLTARCLIREAPANFQHRLNFLEDTKTNTQLFILDCPQYTVVAFRGTDPATFDSIRDDLRTDLNAKRHAWMYDGTFDGSKAAGKRGFIVHRGFGTGFESIRDELRETLDRFLSSDPAKPIFVTGHSLGGGLAALCACYLRSQPVLSSHPVQLYTYAQPRVCIKAMAEHYWLSDTKLTYYRMANFLDTITMVPSKYLADEVADGLDLLIDSIKHLNAEVPFALAEIAAWQTKQWAREHMKDLCPPELDYRHFGTLVLCGVDATNRPFVMEIGKGLPRAIEHESNPKLQSIYRSKIGFHPMGQYRRFMMRAFEQHAAAYLKTADAPLPMSGTPALSAIEIQLFHRHVHSAGIPAYHPIEDYRGKSK